MVGACSAADELDPLDDARVTTTATPPMTATAPSAPQRARDARAEGRVGAIVCVFAVSGPPSSRFDPVERIVSFESTAALLG
jgi:hypothetical protein